MVDSIFTYTTVKLWFLKTRFHYTTHRINNCASVNIPKFLSIVFSFKKQLSYMLLAMITAVERKINTFHDILYYLSLLPVF